jgi:hypothetical protein
MSLPLALQRIDEQLKALAAEQLHIIKGLEALYDVQLQTRQEIAALTALADPPRRRR